MGHPGRSPHSYLVFSFFGKVTVPHARPTVSDLLPGTQIVLSLRPNSHTQLPSQRRTRCLLRRPVPLEPLLLPEASSLCIQVSRHSSPGASTVSEATLATCKIPLLSVTKGLQPAGSPEGPGHPLLQQASNFTHPVPFGSSWVFPKRLTVFAHLLPSK